MTETVHFGLPLLAAGQAQKHVTLNEALLRLDGLLAGAVESATVEAPPPVPADSTAFVVPANGTQAWGASAGTISLWLNGGWLHIAPRAGQRVWVRDSAAFIEYDGTSWQAAGATAARDGHAALRSLTIDHDLSSGTETVAVIPDKAVVIGVTARVLADIGGTGVTTWQLGVPDAPGRYGSGYGCASGSWAQGLTSAPMPYYGDTALRLDGDHGVPDSGRVRLCVHCHVLTPPAMP